MSGSLFKCGLAFEAAKPLPDLATQPPTKYASVAVVAADAAKTLKPQLRWNDCLFGTSLCWRSGSVTTPTTHLHETSTAGRS
jgi:hypothetical protein